jgi:hypothetical protein
MNDSASGVSSGGPAGRVLDAQGPFVSSMAQSIATRQRLRLTPPEDQSGCVPQRTGRGRLRFAQRLRRQGAIESIVRLARPSPRLGPLRRGWPSGTLLRIPCGWPVQWPESRCPPATHPNCSIS